MIVRQWYAQLDVFDTIRRYLALLNTGRCGRAVPGARLFISDFYLINHSSSAPNAHDFRCRRAFTSLKYCEARAIVPQLYVAVHSLQQDGGDTGTGASQTLSAKGLFRRRVS
jgi:hypothetical protein